MDNGIIRQAAIQIIAEPNDVVKVAGTLGKIKRWIRGLINPTVRREIDILDRKYDKVRPLIIQLQSSIDQIEKSIEDVDMYSYDSAMQSLSKTLTNLISNLSGLQQAVDIHQDAASTSGNAAEQRKPGWVTLIDRDLQSLLGKKSLRDLEIDLSDIDDNPKEFYNSLKSESFGGYGKHGVRSFAANKNMTDEDVYQFLEKAESSHILQKFVRPAMLQMPIAKMSLDQSKENSRDYLFTLELVGKNISFDIGDPQKYLMAINIKMDVFGPSRPKNKQDLKLCRFKVNKHYVTSIKSEEAVVPSEQPSSEEAGEQVK